MKVCVAIPTVFTSIHIDQYLKIDDKSNCKQQVLDSCRDSMGKFDFEKYKEVLKEHKRKKQMRDCILTWVNGIVLTSITASLLYGIYDPLYSIFFFLSVLAITFIVDIICVLRIRVHMKQIGEIYIFIHRQTECAKQNVQTECLNVLLNKQPKH